MSIKLLIHSIYLSAEFICYNFATQKKAPLVYFGRNARFNYLQAVKTVIFLIPVSIDMLLNYNV